MAKQEIKRGNSRAKAADPRSGARIARKAERLESTPPVLDRVIHERLRLAMLSALAVNDSLTFSELKGLLKITDGNLSVHARKLEDAEYVACEKSFEGRTPRTEYRMTAAGRRALSKYLDEMESLIRKMRR